MPRDLDCDCIFIIIICELSSSLWKHFYMLSRYIFLFSLSLFLFVGIFNFHDWFILLCLISILPYLCFLIWMKCILCILWNCYLWTIFFFFIEVLNMLIRYTLSFALIIDLFGVHGLFGYSLIMFSLLLWYIHWSLVSIDLQVNCHNYLNLVSRDMF